MISSFSEAILVILIVVSLFLEMSADLKFIIRFRASLNHFHISDIEVQ